MQNFVLIYEAAFSFREIHPLIPLIGRIHGAIVAATGRSDRRGDRRGDDRPVYTPYRPKDP